MKRPSFISETNHVRQAITSAPLRDFAVPHLIIDDILPAQFVEKINDNWPSSDLFQPEVPGNYQFQMYRRDYPRIAEPAQSFWKGFNEVLWPTVIAFAAEAMSEPAFEVFGTLLRDHLMPEIPLTLMQADPNYIGQDRRAHV